MSRSPQDKQDKKELTPKQKKLAEFGEVMHEVFVYEPKEATRIFRSFEIAPTETPESWLERMQAFAGPMLMKIGFTSIMKNPGLSSKIFMYLWKPVIDKQAIDLTVRQQSQVDILSDAEVVKGLVRELIRNPESRRILEDEIGKAEHQLGRPELPEKIENKKEGDNNEQKRGNGETYLESEENS